MANSVDPDFRRPIWVCTVCSGLSVRIFRIIMESTATSVFMPQILVVLMSSGKSACHKSSRQKSKIYGKKKVMDRDHVGS